LHALDSTTSRRSERALQLALFLSSVFWFLAADVVAVRASRGLSERFSLGPIRPLLTSIFLLFLLALGFTVLQTLTGRRAPLRDIFGLPRRPTAAREWSLGASLGWGLVVLAILPMALARTLNIHLWAQPRAFGLLLLNLLTLAVAALAEEVAFRGYPFQRLIDATNPTLATIFMSLLFGAIHLANPGATFSSTIVTIFAGWLLAIMYLRTRALWVAWGFHFTWNATMGILFGLPISGITSFSPVVASNTVGPLWITGGDYGPEGSLICAIVILVLIFVTIRATRDLKYRYAQPVIIPAGIPVDIDAISRRQHEAAMGPQPPTPPQIVQISGIQTPNSREEASPAPAPLGGGEAVPTPITPAEVPPRETR